MGFFSSQKPEALPLVNNGIELSIVVDALEEKGFSRSRIENILSSIVNTPLIHNVVEGYNMQILEDKIIVSDLLE
jgi:hypothetical protein